MIDELSRRKYAEVVAEIFTPEQVRDLLVKAIRDTQKISKRGFKKDGTSSLDRTVDSRAVLDVLRFVADIVPMKTPAQLEKIITIPKDDLRTKTGEELRQLARIEAERILRLTGGDASGDGRQVGARAEAVESEE